jgi:uncharacterized membrane-anchored protein
LSRWSFSSRRSATFPWAYWLAVVLISVVGTLITDNLVDNFGVRLETTTIWFSVALIATFAVWYAFEKTLSIHTIFTTRREIFYWLAILFTFSLGTAAGDLPIIAKLQEAGVTSYRGIAAALNGRGVANSAWWPVAGVECAQSAGESGFRPFIGWSNCLAI